MVSSGWTQWRRYCVAVGAAVVITAGVAFAPPALALGLGEIDTRSALNERFSAEIELLDTRGLQASEVLASLASTDDFRRVGVERFFFLTSLQFEVVRNARGNLVIKATSQQPITEPYLNFLVEVLWPSGRLLKEYTVLLDPPTFTHSAAAPVATPSREQGDSGAAGRIDRGTASAGTASPPSSQARVRTPAPRVSANDGTYGRTTRSDTMWTIANETLPSGNVTPQQNMMAIQRLNPTAFIDGNVNLLKAGVVLRLPSEAQAAELSNDAAEAEINRQNQAWRTGRTGQAQTASAAEAASPDQSAAPIDATSRGPGVANNAPASQDGRLRIVAAEATGPTSASDSAGSSDSEAAIAGDPAAQEQLEAMARQVDELTYQLDLQKRGVEEQISAREQQISVKDQQIAQLQEQLRKLREQAGNAQSPDQNTRAGAAADTQPFWQKPAVLGSGLGALALLLAGFLFKRRRDNAADELEVDSYVSGEPSFELGPSEQSEFATPVADADLVGDLADADLALDAAAAQSEADLEDELSTALDDDDLFGPADDAQANASGSADPAQTSDVIGEADIYIAYGRYPQAIALLQGAVDSNPADHAVRMRLIEVSAETKDAQGYAEQLGLLRQNCNDPEVLAAASSLHDSLDDELRNEVDGLIGESSAADSGASAGVVAGAGAALAAGAASLLADDDDPAESQSLTEEFSEAADTEEFTFDTTVTQGADDLDDGGLSLSGEFDAVLPDADTNDAGEFELDLDVADDTELDVPAVNTDEFATNVEMDTALPEIDSTIDAGVASVADDFELDLDPEASAALTELGNSDAQAALSDDLGGDLGLDFPDETAELERVVADTDDDELLDEIERSLDELEADGLLTTEVDDEVEFSFDDDADTSATKLDLARAYIDMGDDDGAREILGEVLAEGDSNQQGEANELLGKL